MVDPFLFQQFQQGTRFQLSLHTAKGGKLLPEWVATKTRAALRKRVLQAEGYQVQVLKITPDGGLRAA